MFIIPGGTKDCDLALRPFWLAPEQVRIITVTGDALVMGIVYRI